MTEVAPIPGLPEDPRSLLENSYFAASGHLALQHDGQLPDLQEVGDLLHDYFRHLGRRGLAGLLVTSFTGETDRVAFVGPYIPPNGPEGYSADEPAVSATIMTTSTEPLHHKSYFRITDERREEIAGGYVLPEHLKLPDNAIDAGIGYVVAKLAGIDYDVTKSFQDMAVESQANVLANPDITEGQASAAILYGESSLGEAQFNAHSRGEQLESLEHTLRFIFHEELARKKAVDEGKFRLYMSTDYNSARGALGDALIAVTGTSSFGTNRDEHKLTMGLLPPKTWIIINEQGTFVTDPNRPAPDNLKPIWPLEMVDAYLQEREAEAQAAEEERLVHLEADRALASALEEMEAAQLAEQEALLGDTRLEVEALLEAGYTWKGIQVRDPRGRLGTDEGLQAYLRETYPGKKVHVFHNIAIYGGEKITLAPGSVTIYAEE